MSYFYYLHQNGTYSNLANYTEQPAFTPEAGGEWVEGKPAGGVELWKPAPSVIEQLDTLIRQTIAAIDADPDVSINDADEAALFALSAQVREALTYNRTNAAITAVTAAQFPDALSDLKTAILQVLSS